MKFLWIVKRDWKHPGPIVHVALKNAYALAKVGHESHLILGEGDTSDTEVDLHDFYGLDSLDNFYIHRIKRKGLLSSRPIICYAINLAQQLKKGRERVTLITRETTYLPSLAKLSHDGKFRTIYETHDFFSDLKWKSNSITLQDRRYQLLEKHYLPHISGILCITLAQARFYASHYPSTPTLALPLGAEMHSPTKNFVDRLHLRRVVYVGHLNSQKGIRDLLSCAKLLYENYKVITAFWGGTQKQIERFFKPKVVKKISRFIEYIPFRSPAELSIDLQTRATLGILPLSDTYYNRYLTCPAKALDYISHCLPVVATDLPTNRWLLQDAAIYYPPGDKSALANAIFKALEPENYFRLCSAAARRAKELSYRNRAKKLIDFAKELHFQINNNSSTNNKSWCRTNYQEKPIL